MFHDPKDLARAALELLAVCDEKGASKERTRAAELGAALLAYHVWDWHKLTGRKPTDLDAFKAAHPELEELRQVANGLKHAKSTVAGARPEATRDVAWEDSDFWWAPHERTTLFLDVAGETRSVAALVRGFASSYLRSG